MIVLSPEVIEIIGESLCEDFIKQLESCQKESDHYIMDNTQVFFEERGKNTYIQSIGEKKKEKEPKKKFIVFSEHFFVSIRERFVHFSNSDEEGIKKVIYASFMNTAVKLGGQYENNFIYKITINNSIQPFNIYIPVVERVDSIFLKTALTEEQGLNNLSEKGAVFDPKPIPKVVEEKPKEIYKEPPKFIEEILKNHNINLPSQYKHFIDGLLLLKQKTFEQYVKLLIQKDYETNKDFIKQFVGEVYCCSPSELNNIRKKYRKKNPEVISEKQPEQHS